MSVLIYSRLKASNTLNGFTGEGKERKHYSIEFKPELDKKDPDSGRTKLTDEEYKILIGDKEGMFNVLLKQGDFVEVAKESKNDVESLKGEMKALQLKLKEAEKEAVKVAKEEKDKKGK